MLLFLSTMSSQSKSSIPAGVGSQHPPEGRRRGGQVARAPPTTTRAVLGDGTVCTCASACACAVTTSLPETSAVRNDTAVYLIPWEESPYQVCTGFVFTSASSLLGHHRSSHLAIEISFRCRRCSREFSRPHQVSAHYATCAKRSQAPPKPAGRFLCSVCPARFPTLVGRTQHMRRFHPNQANEERASVASGSATAGPKHLVGATDLWSAAEVQLLRELETRYRGVPRINMRLMEHFPGKSNKQISNKRQQLKGAEAVGSDGEAGPAPPHVAQDRTAFEQSASSGGGGYRSPPCCTKPRTKGILPLRGSGAKHDCAGCWDSPTVSC